MRFVLFISFFLITKICCAQSTYKGIEGTLQDKNRQEAIAFAKVIVKSVDTTYNTITDLDGKFSIPTLKNGDYSVEFSFDGGGFLYPEYIQINDQSQEIYSVKANFSFTDTEDHLFINRDPVIKE